MYYQYNYTDVAYITWEICNSDAREFNYITHISDESQNNISCILNKGRFNKPYVYPDKDKANAITIAKAREGVVNDIRSEISKHIKSWDRIFNFETKREGRNICLNRLDAFTLVFFILYPPKDNELLAKICNYEVIYEFDSLDLYKFRTELVLFLSQMTVIDGFLWDKSVLNTPTNTRKQNIGEAIPPFQPITREEILNYVQPIDDVLSVYYSIDDAIDSVNRAVQHYYYEIKKPLNNVNLFKLSSDELQQIMENIDKKKTSMIDEIINKTP